MSNTSPDIKEIFNVFTFISERGVISGLYIASLSFGLVLGNTKHSIPVEAYLWIMGACILIGLIASNVTFELLIKFYRAFTNPLALRKFRLTVGKGISKKITTYDELNKYISFILASADCPSYYHSQHQKHEGLRQTLTYLSSSSIFAMVMVFIAYKRFDIYPDILELEMWIIGFIFISSTIGTMVRSDTLGKIKGRMYTWILVNCPDKLKAFDN